MLYDKPVIFFFYSFSIFQHFDFCKILFHSDNASNGAVQGVTCIQMIDVETVVDINEENVEDNEEETTSFIKKGKLSVFRIFLNILHHLNQ